jgi:hypothetical protein
VVAKVTVVITEVAGVTDTARAVMGQDDSATAVWVVVIVRVVRGSIEEPRAKVMPVGKPKTRVVECRTGVKAAAMEYGTANSETTAMERRAATSETAAMERRAAASETAAMECSAATMHSSAAAMEPASSTMESAAAASTVETTSAAVPSAATVASATSTTATTDFGRHPPGGGFGDRCCARTNQGHGLGALAWCGRQRQHRRRCKPRAQDVTHRTACGA